MPTNLVYHTLETAQNGTSPFDATIMEMVEANDLQITAPYLGLEYLERMIHECNSWQLITDIQAMLSTQSVAKREGFIEFIIANKAMIHHCKDLHAKVLIAGNRALVGSANFTDKGITKRVEMSVSFEDSPEVTVLKSWFNLLWSQTACVEESDLQAFAASLPSPTPAPSTFSLPCAHPGVRSRLLQTSANTGDPNAEERLIAHLRLAPSRKWADSWLSLANDLIETTRLGPDDDRLVMSLPIGNFLPITINRRYVLCAFRKVGEGSRRKVLNAENLKSNDRETVELILPADMKSRIPHLSNVIRHSWFDPGFRGETDENVPQFASFSVPEEFEFAPEVLEAWRAACVAECDHQRISNFRRFHEPVVYRAVVDTGYRRNVLDRAFNA